MMPVLFHGQAEKYKFQVKDDKQAVQKNRVLIANGENVITNNSGIFVLTLSTNLFNIGVQTADEKKYVIRYPESGIISLPKNPGDVVVITIAAPNRNDQANALKNQLAGQITKLDKEIRNLKNNDEQMRKILLRRIDSLFTIGQRNNINKDDLRTARELMIGRDTSFVKISNTLNAYINEAKDLSDALKLAEMALTEKGARDQLIAAIGSYNPVYEEFNMRKDEYEKSIDAFWRSKELSYNFLNLYGFALDEIHRPYILPLNDLVKMMNEYNMKKNSKEKKGLKKKILDEAERATRDMDRRLVILGEKSNTLQTILKSLM